MDGTELGAVFSSLGVGGILAWYLWYTASKLLPRLNAENNEAQRNLAALNREVVQAFREDLKEERRVRLREIEVIGQVVRELQGKPDADPTGRRQQG